MNPQRRRKRREKEGKRKSVEYQWNVNPQKRKGREERKKKGKRKSVGNQWNELDQPLKGETRKNERWKVFLSLQPEPNDHEKEKRCWNIKGTCVPNPVTAKKTSYLAVWLP